MRERLLAFFSGILLVGMAMSMMGSTPNSNIKQGTRYRFIYTTAGLSAAQPIRFPTTSNAIASSYVRSVTWVHITQWNNPGGGTEVQHAIHSPQFPDGADTVSTSEFARSFTFGGCQIDSVIINCNGVSGFQGGLLATD